MDTDMATRVTVAGNTVAAERAAARRARRRHGYGMSSTAFVSKTGGTNRRRRRKRWSLNSIRS